MVTVEEQLSGQQSQISEAEQNIAEQRKQLNEQEQQVNAIQTPQRSIGFQFAVIKNNPKIAGRVEQTIYERQRIKQEGLSQIQTARQNISEYEQNILFPAKAQLSSAQLEMSEWKQAEALAGTDYGGLASQNNPSLHAKVLQIESGNKASFESAKQFSVLKSQGLEPVFGNVAGGITGYTDVQTGKSIPLENLGTYISTNKSTSIPILMSAGLFQMKEAPTVTVTDIKSQFEPPVKSFALIQQPVKEKSTGEKVYDFLTRPAPGVQANVTATGIFGKMETAIQPYREKAQNASRNFQISAINEIKEHPVRTGALVGVAIIAPEVLAGVGAGATALGLGTTATFIGEGVAYTAPVIIGGQIAGQISSAPQGEKASTAGKIFGGEVLPLLVGAGIGMKAVPAVKGYFSTLGRAEIQTESIVSQEVLTGKENFPYAGKNLPTQQRAELHQQLFEQGKFNLPGYEDKLAGYHATPQGSFLKESFTATPGTSEFEGLYVSGKGVSTHFLKLQGNQMSLYGGNVFQGYGKPAVAFIETETLVTGKSAQLGQAFIPGVKPEVEAIFPTGSEFQKTGSDYFFKLKGTRVPIDEYKSVQSGTSVQTKSVQQIKSSYSYREQPSLIKPGSILSSLRVSSSSVKSSVVSIAPSNVYSSSQSNQSFVTSNPRSSNRSYNAPSISSIYSGSRMSASPRSSFNIQTSISPIYSGSSSYGSSKSKPSAFPLFNLGLREKRTTKKKFIEQPLAYEPSLSSSIFNIKLKGGIPKSGLSSVGVRRGTFSLKQLRKINKGVSIF